MRTIAVIRGDGIGPEVIDAAIQVLNASRFDYEPIELSAGYATYQEQKTSIPEETIQGCKDADAVLFGAVTTPPDIPNYKSAIVTLRKELDVYANVRPVRAYDDRNIDLVVVRENTEGLYVGEETREGDVAQGIRRITKKGSQRIAKYAYQYARENNRKKVTIVHKANVLRETDALFKNTAREVAANYPEIETEERLVDACAMQLVRNPIEFDILLTTNMFGDILSDEAAGLVGSLGLVPSANIGAEHALFEPVHGSAPDIAGKGIANPTAAILSATMMLAHLGEYEKANQIRNAVEVALQTMQTPDLGGTASTIEFTTQVIKTLGGQ